MRSLTTFQIVAIGLCIFFGILGVGVFAAFGGLVGGSKVGPVTIWGTTDAEQISALVAELRNSNKALDAVTYVQKDPARYDAELLNAMAAGTGPDLFLVSQDNLESFADKIALVPYSSVPQSQFANAFIDEGTLFLVPQGALALPFSVDPLVMYWNRDLFAAAGVASAPQYWNDFLTIAPKLTSLSGSTVQKSAVALGLWQNVDNAKAILSTLFMQTGDNIVVRAATGAPTPVFGQTPDTAAENPAESALRFYTEFANPGKTTYSWNGSLPKASDAFAAGDLGVYFGFASEMQTIAQRNPNLRFGVALMPQLQGNAVHLTFGELTGLAISRTAQNPAGALAVAEALSGQQAVAAQSQATGLPPVRRDVSLDTAGSASISTFVQSSLIARGWLDPSPAQSDTIFEGMISEVTSGAQEPAGAVAEGSQRIAQLFNAH